MIPSEKIKEFRRTAEESVSDMPEGELKIKAFEVILQHLLSSAMISDPASNAAGKALSTKNPRSKSSHRQESETARKKKKTLPDYIFQLREDGFFKEPRVPTEVHEKLQSIPYHCLINRVEVALVRMADRKILRLATKKSTIENIALTCGS